MLAEKDERRKSLGRRKLKRTKKPVNVPFNPAGNKGSLFVSSKNNKGRHFTIHPEWF